MYCTMAHLSLGISANDLQVPGRHEEAILLLWGCLGEKGGEEHAQMKIQRLRPSTMNKAVKRCHGMEREGSVMGGKQARRFMVEIEEKTKRKKQCKIRIQQVYFRKPEHCPFLRSEQYKTCLL